MGAVQQGRRFRRPDPSIDTDGQGRIAAERGRVAGQQEMERFQTTKVETATTQGHLSGVNGLSSGTGKGESVRGNCDTVPETKSEVNSSLKRSVSATASIACVSGSAKRVAG